MRIHSVILNKKSGIENEELFTCDFSRRTDWILNPSLAPFIKQFMIHLFISNTHWGKRFTLQAISLLGTLSLFEDMFYLNDYMSDTLSQKIIQNLQSNIEIWLVYVMLHHRFQARMQRGASAYFIVNTGGKKMIFMRRDRAWLLQYTGSGGFL